MKERASFVFVVLLMLFVLFGCVAPGVNKLPCCERQSAMQNGNCYLQSSDSSISTNPDDYCPGCSLLYCAFAEIDPSTNETKYYEISPGGSKQELDCEDLHPDEFNDPLHPCNNIGFCVYFDGNTHHVAFPICSERPRYPCEQPNCTSMFCGGLKYAPRKTFLPQTGFDAALQPIDADYPIGLYHASCNFYELTHETIKKIEKSTNIFQNTFRFAIGVDINDFEEARWYFPVSDFFTSSFSSMVSLPLTLKDRFANYLCAKKKVIVGSNSHSCDLWKWTTTSSTELSQHWDVYTSFWNCRWNGNPSGDAYLTLDWVGDHYVLRIHQADWPCGSNNCGTHDVVSLPSSMTQNVQCSVRVTDCDGHSFTLTVTPSTSPHSARMGGNDQCGEIKTVDCTGNPGSQDYSCFTCDNENDVPDSNECPWYTDQPRCEGNTPPDGATKVDSCALTTYTYEWRDCNNPPPKGSTVVDWMWSTYDPSSFFNRSFCARDYWFFPPLAIPGAQPGQNTPYTEGTPGIGLVQNYNFTTFTEIGDSDLGISFSRVLINPEFYKQHLLEAYWNWIYYHPEDTSSFECEDGPECISTICSKDPDFGYVRGICEKTNGDKVNCLCYEKGVRGYDAKVYCLPVYDDPNIFREMKATIVEGSAPSSPPANFTCHSTSVSMDFYISFSFSIPVDALGGLAWPELASAGLNYASAYQGAPLISDEVCLDNIGFNVVTVPIYKVIPTGSYSYVNQTTGVTCTVTNYTSVFDHVDVWITCGNETVVPENSSYCTEYDTCLGCIGETEAYTSSSAIPVPDSTYHGMKKTMSFSENICTDGTITYYEIPSSTSYPFPINDWCCESVTPDNTYTDCILGSIPPSLCDGVSFSYSSLARAIPSTEPYLFNETTDCSTYPSNPLCALGSSGGGSGSSSETQVPSPPITFFQDPIDGYIGYSVADDFPDSLIAKKCNLDYDYEIITEPFFYDNASDIEKLACLEWQDIPSIWGVGGKVCVKYYKNLYKIKSLGDCEPDDGDGIVKGQPIPNFPKIVKLFGWCEPKGFVTMVRIDLENVVSEYGLSRSIPVEDTWSGSNGFGPVFGINKLQGTYVKKFVQDVSLFRNRIDHYLKSNVMPIVWYPYSSLTGKLYAAHKYKVADDVTNAGSKVSFGCDNDEADTTLVEVLTGNLFFYSPDMEPFFTSASACCYYKTESVHNRDGDYDVIRAAPSSDSGIHLWGKKSADDVYCNWDASYPVLKRFIGDSASLVIISTGTSPNNGRLAQARSQCPRCLFAHYNSDWTIFATSPTLWRNYDVVVWNYVIGGNLLYEGENSTSYPKAIFDELKKRGHEILSTAGKPSLVFIYVSKPTPMWSNEDALRVMSYLLRNKQDLIKAGIIGVLYPDWDGTTSFSLVPSPLKSVKDDHFCAVEQSVDLYLVPKKEKAIFVRIPAESSFSDGANPLPAPKCVECDPMSKRSGRCTRQCLNLDVNGNPVECVLNPSLPSDDQMCPLTAVNTQQYPCADCMQLFAQGWTIKCDLEYDDGTKQTLIYGPSWCSTCDVKIDDPSKYPDVFASLPIGQHCCIFDSQQGNFTYIGYDSAMLTPAMIVFPTKGAENAECGPVPDKNKFCGVVLPVRDYIMNCTWVK